MNRPTGMMSAPHRLGARIRRVREEQGLTQEDLAQRALMTQSSVARIERGHVTPRIRTVQQLATALGVSSWSHLLGTDNRDKPA